jgi:hypothetical protein
MATKPLAHDSCCMAAAITVFTMYLQEILIWYYPSLTMNPALMYQESLESNFKHLYFNKALNCHHTLRYKD